MAKKQMLFKTKGMNQDLSVSAFNPEFSFENRNLRISTNEGNTLMSWVNEKGTAPLEIYQENANGNPLGNKLEIEGIVIGTAVLNSFLVLFVKGEDADRIYRLRYIDNTKNVLQGKIIYNGNGLKLDVNHPLETLVSYESELVQKVYWVDGINQPRVINICKDYRYVDVDITDYNPFDFIQTLKLQEEVYVQKQFGGGMFASGVIQYAFTYYNKYGPETNIFYTTPLYYISYRDRGGSPEDKVENSFVIRITNLDDHFEYLRIYSIHRTSINGTPICKRIQDIEITPDMQSASYIDTGTSGDSIDPTELLYKGGETIIAETIEQKDGTLFLGGLTNIRKPITDNMYIGKTRVNLKNNVEALKVVVDERTSTTASISVSPYVYNNQLSLIETRNGELTTVPCGGFKTGNYYRLGLQFQHESGKWSDPIYINGKNDVPQGTGIPREGGNNTLITPIFKTEIDATTVSQLAALGYKRARGCMVVPTVLDKDIICQGVTCPTLYTRKNRNIDKDIWAQSSWFFRPYCADDISEGKRNTTMFPKRGFLRYTQRNVEWNVPDSGALCFHPDFMRQVEIEGDFEDDNKFQTSPTLRTLHSPDIEFDDQIKIYDFADCSIQKAGEVCFTKTMSDIDIQTETPTVSNAGSGFYHKAFTDDGPRGIVSGLFYDDYIVDDKLGDDKHLGAYPNQKASCKWLIYPWQGTGSLNNDINRPSSKGIATTKLKKKIISNLRVSNTWLYGYETRSRNRWNKEGWVPQIFSGEEDSILKIGGNIYKGNIDTTLIPDNADGVYFCFDGLSLQPVKSFTGYGAAYNFTEAKTSFESSEWCKVFSKKENEPDGNGIRKFMAWRDDRGNHAGWIRANGDIGDDYLDLAIKKLPVRMKYKSTPHLIFYADINTNIHENTHGTLSIAELVHTTNDATRYGGKSTDALKENVWIPCGEPSNLVSGSSTTVHFRYGDTYYQRYDCLKTYPYTKEDLNLIVEIGSFMLESYVNIDGRYDRNRGQSNNLNMTPQNFNLMNPVYSQTNNFFSYKIQDDSYYKNNKYPNQITWSKTKSNSADTDMWANVTLASILELDGDKGKINKLVRLNNYLFAFQDTGIAQILYNDNVQIQSVQGVPIEIANSGKVQGKDYKSDTVGCSNKWAMTTTPNGIYFIDSYNKGIYLFNGQLTNISVQAGFNSWCKKNIPTNNIKWTPLEFNTFRSYYDKLNQDVLFVNKDTALAFSEKLNVFTSFYDYGNIPFFCNLDDTGLWVTNPRDSYKNIRPSANSFKYSEDKIEPIIGENEGYGDYVLCLKSLDYEVKDDFKIIGKEYNYSEVYMTGYFLTQYTTQEGQERTEWQKKNTKIISADEIYKNIRSTFLGCSYIYIWSTKGTSEEVPSVNPQDYIIYGKITTTNIWKHQAGDYCKFFDKYKPYGITLVGNPEPQTDKIFTNLEFRACVEKEGYPDGGPFDDTFDPTFPSGSLNKFSFTLPFDYLETWDEYQHGYTKLSDKQGHNAMTHHTSDMNSALKRKFRIWKCDIPRNNCLLDSERKENEDYLYSKDSELNISRYYKKPQDRMRNPWIYLKLQKVKNVSSKCEIHDLVMTYFN